MKALVFEESESKLKYSSKALSAEEQHEVEDDNSAEYQGVQLIHCVSINQSENARMVTVASIPEEGCTKRRARSCSTFIALKSAARAINTQHSIKVRMMVYPIFVLLPLHCTVPRSLLVY